MNRTERSKEWLRFTKTKDGIILNFSIQTLPESRFEDFLDFKIKYYVSQETVHVASGIASSKETLEDYKQVYMKLLRHPSIKIVVCFLEKDETPEIVGFSIVKLLRRSEKQTEITVQPKTPLMKRFLDIFDRWEEAFVVLDLMKQYNVKAYFDDEGLATHPDYRGLGIAQKFVRVRAILCKHYGVTLTGGWVTSRGSDVAVTRESCTKVFEITKEEFSRKLQLKLPEYPLTYKYFIINLSKKEISKL